MVAIVIQDHPLKRTGIFFSISFLIGNGLNIFAFSMMGQGSSFLQAVTHPTVVSLYVFTALLILSTVKKRFSFIQPLLFLGIAPFPLIQTPLSVYGLGIFISGVILLYKGGYLERRRAVKLALLIVYLYAILFFAALGKSPYSTYALGPLFFTTAFLAFLYLVFKEQVVVYLKEKKPILSLAEKGLSEAEAAYVRAAAKGLSPKEMAAEFGVTESTIRNTMSRAYKKLGVADKAGLAALLASHELEGQVDELVEKVVAAAPGNATALQAAATETNL